MVLDAPIDVVWGLVLLPSTLDFVAKPLIKFIPTNAYPPAWVTGKYPVKLYLLGLVAIGSQVIVIEFPESPGAKRVMRDNGYGEGGSLKVVRRWDHFIELSAIDDMHTRYCDIVEVKAGIVTPFVWAFASVFYAWRQFRWRRLIREG